MSIRTGLVGISSRFWSQSYARCLAAIEESDFVAVADINYEPEDNVPPEEFARQHKVKLYHDAVEMIEKEGLEAVCVRTKHTEMADFVELVASAGANMYITKPMATTMTDADRIVKAVRENSLIATSGSTGRFEGGISEAYRRLKSGVIGDLISIRLLHQHGRIDIAYSPDHWYMDEEQGGPELSLGWYAADILRWFAGSDVVRVYAEYDNYLSEGSPFMDNGKAVLRFKNKVIGSFDIYFSVDWAFPSWEVELMGTSGSIRTQQSINGGLIFTKSGTVSYENRSNMFLEEIQDWVNCCVNKTEPSLNIEDARSVIEICLACRESAKTNLPVAIPVAELGI